MPAITEPNTTTISDEEKGEDNEFDAASVPRKKKT